MNFFALCPNCKLALRLMPPNANPENEAGLLMNSAEILPIELNHQARWFFACPDCQGRFVLWGYLTHPREGDVTFSVIPLEQHRSLRERALQGVNGRHLGKMLEESFLPSWIFSCIVGFVWGLVTWQEDLLWLACGFLLALIPLLIFALLFTKYIRPLSGEFVSFIGTIAWLITTAFVGKTEFFISLGALLLSWSISLSDFLKHVKGDTLIAVEQELLQLRPLSVAPRYWVKAEHPYR